MEYIFLFVCAYIFLSVVFNASKGVNTLQRCDEKGEPHEWIIAGSEDATYMVCNRCRILPGGIKEENEKV